MKNVLVGHNYSLMSRAVGAKMKNNVRSTTALRNAHLLKPKHLQLLVALDDLRNVGQVAVNANVTQPAISKALGDLERSLGVKLFERTARGVIPTNYGECLIAHARTLLVQLTHAKNDLTALISGRTGITRVGTHPYAMESFLPQCIALLKQRSPGTTVLLREGNMDRLVPELWAGTLDLVVGRISNSPSRLDLEEKILGTQAVELAVRNKHPLAQGKKLRWSDLNHYPWVLPPIGTMIRESFELLLERHALPIPSDRLETLSVHMVRDYLQITDAIAVLPEEVSKHYKDLGLISTLPLLLPTLVRPLGIAWSRQRSLSAGTKLMIKCLEEVFTHLALKKKRKN